MPTQAIQTEEENVIILDDIIEEDTSPEIKIEEPISSEEIIDFGNNEEDLKISDNTNIDFGNINTSSEESIVSNNDSSLDLGDFDLNSDITGESIDPIIEEKQISTTIPNEVDEINLGSEVSLDNTSELGGGSFQDDGQTKDNSSNLNSILDETIVKLQFRSNIISEDKNVEQNNIKDFKSQISDLESNVNNSEVIVSELNKEAAKIRSNIKSLERMKMKDEIEEAKKQTSAKIHNSKRSR